nr:HAMP domain-containing sensor histidine kinase [Heyndrickxia ginsengihumi]
MKLNIKLPLLFLLMFVLIIVIGIPFIRFFVIGNLPVSQNKMKAKAAFESVKIANHIASLYPNMEKIDSYIKNTAKDEHISIQLYNHDLSKKMISYQNNNKAPMRINDIVPVQAKDNHVVFYLEIRRSMISSESLGLYILFPLLVLIGLAFMILTLYFHFNITKPIQVLNKRLKNVNIRGLTSFLSITRKDEIGELYNHFNEMEERLHLAQKEQIDMIAAIAHDLKTPLTSINGFVELLVMQKDLSENERQEYYELILKKSKHIGELINDFSAFTKNELELETMDMKAVEAARLFENIATEYEAELSGLGYELFWKHSFKPSQFMMMNEHMIGRVFGNLFSNAVRYGNQGNLTIYLSGFVQGSSVYFQVEDNGQGVPEKDMSSLFLKFFTVDKSRQTQNGGTGLGLASCKSIIERHGGEISAFHSPYGGLGIRFSVPLQHD